jgi:hypothetical protein
MHIILLITPKKKKKIGQNRREKVEGRHEKRKERNM